MSWITFAILAATSFGFYNFFTKISADKLSPAIALLFITGVSFLVAVVTTIVFKLSGQDISFSKNAVLFPILAGISVGVAEIFYLLMFSKNAPITIGNPIVVGGTAIIAVILGLIVLKEPLDTAKIAGIFLTLTGLIILVQS